MGTRCADHATPLYPQKLALTSPTGGGRSVGIVRSRTKATQLSLKSKLTVDQCLFNAQMFLQPHHVSHRRHDLYEVYKPTSARYHKCKQVFMHSVCLFCPILMKLEFSPQVLLNCSKVKHPRKSVQWLSLCYTWKKSRNEASSC